MTQRRRGYFDPDIQEKQDSGKAKLRKPDFIFRGGCTLLIDPDTARVRYCIYKRIRSENRLNRIREFLTGDITPSASITYFNDLKKVYFQKVIDGNWRSDGGLVFEPFALLHRSTECEEVL
jgi:hypothetical protein